MKVAGQKIKVGAYTFKVRRAKTTDCGTCDVAKQQITVGHWVRNVEMLRATLVHECLHAILETHQHFDVSGNEPLIECLANGLVQVLRDNPWLADVLTARDSQ